MRWTDKGLYSILNETGVTHKYTHNLDYLEFPKKKGEIKYFQQDLRINWIIINFHHFTLNPGRTEILREKLNVSSLTLLIVKLPV